MKKIIAVLLVCVLAAALASCAGGNTKDGASTTGVSEASTAGESTTRKRDLLKTVEPVTDKNGDVIITCPPSFFDEGTTPSTELTEEQKEKGFKKAYVNKDGSLSYVINGEDFEAVRESAKEDTRAAFNGYPERLDFIKKVLSSEDFSVINIQVDSEGFSSNVSGYAVIWEIGLYAQLAQVMSGVTPDMLTVDIVVSDAETGEVIEATHYPLEK